MLISIISSNNNVKSTQYSPRWKDNWHKISRSKIVLDDNFNTFQHVANCLLIVISGMIEQRAWDLTVKIDTTGSAEVWRGNHEQAELYHEQLVSKGLTMAPIEKT